MQLTTGRVESNKNFARLHPLLQNGVLELLNEKLRWSNEPVEIIPRSGHRILRIDDLGRKIRVRDAFQARVRGKYTQRQYIRTLAKILHSPCKEED